MSRYANISMVNFPTLPADEPGRLQKTLERMCAYIAEAAQEQSDLVAFPRSATVWTGPIHGARSSLWTGRR